MKKFPINTGIIHFVGVGGIGMSGIADILVNIGYKVSGSDLKDNLMTERLARKGIDIKIGHKVENVHNVAVVVVSAAISKDNPEILEARRLKIPVIKRAEMLSELMKMKMSIAIAGTHGKTTTTSLVAALLGQANFDPTVVNGGVINAYNSNARFGVGDWIVVEADESDGSFSKLTSTIAIVTNIDLDHIDNYKNIDELNQVFFQFIEKIPFYGTAILCLDNSQVAKLIKKTIDRNVITYGLSEHADISCRNITLTENGEEFDVVFSEKIVKKYAIEAVDGWKKINLNMFGDHNVQNALAVIAVAVELNISEENTKIALGTFMGVKRRFTKIAEINGVTFIDDYAHHPTEIKVVLEVVKKICKGKIYAVIQPHRYSRLKKFINEFAQSLELSDIAIICPIYTAGEINNGTDHFTLLKILNENKKIQADFSQDPQVLYNKLSDVVKNEDYVVFLGAGDITKWAYAVTEKFSANKNNGV